MGLFGFGKKKQEPLLSPEETARRWNDAYRANPQVYQKNGALLGSCTLTEDVDTILPLRPESQWAVDGKPVPDWILSMVSITEKRVLGQMAYPEAMARLRPFSLASSGDWILIRAMTHNELDGRQTDRFPFPALLSEAKPVVEYLPGWKCDISGVRAWEDLPEAARNYVEYIEKEIGCRIGYVSVGPERDAIILR